LRYTLYFQITTVGLHWGPIVYAHIIYTQNIIVGLRYTLYSQIITVGLRCGLIVYAHPLYTQNIIVGLRWGTLD
jgi:hypothetical protein